MGQAVKVERRHETVDTVVCRLSLIGGFPALRAYVNGYLRTLGFYLRIIRTFCLDVSIVCWRGSPGVPFSASFLLSRVIR